MQYKDLVGTYIEYYLELNTGTMIDMKCGLGVENPFYRQVEPDICIPLKGDLAEDAKKKAIL